MKGKSMHLPVTPNWYAPEQQGLDRLPVGGGGEHGKRTRGAAKAGDQSLARLGATMTLRGIRSR